VRKRERQTDKVAYVPTLRLTLTLFHLLLSLKYYKKLFSHILIMLINYTCIKPFIPISTCDIYNMIPMTKFIINVSLSRCIFPTKTQYLVISFLVHIVYVVFILMVLIWNHMNWNPHTEISLITLLLYEAFNHV